MSNAEENVGFYRTELRVLQSTATDNEDFLNKVAVILAKLYDEKEDKRVTNGLLAEDARLALLELREGRRFSKIDNTRLDRIQACIG